MENLEKDYLFGREVLEDLQYLGDSSLTPLISRAHHHLFEIKRKAEDNVKNPKLYSNVNVLLNRHVENLIHLYLKKNKKLSTVNISLDSSIWNLEDWNNFIEVIPTILAVCGQFEFSNAVSFYQMGKCFYMTGGLALNSDLKSKRKQLYGLFRKLMSKRALMTYDLGESSDEELVLCTLKFDLSHRDDVVYFLPAFAGATAGLAFTNLFADYRLEDHSCLIGMKHTCLKINTNFEMERFQKLPDNLYEENRNCELIHFPFLFHPVSLIIPERGFLKVLDDPHTKKVTPGKECDSNNNMDVDSNIRKTYQHIDFFELITN